MVFLRSPISGSLSFVRVKLQVVRNSNDIQLDVQGGLNVSSYDFKLVYRSLVPRSGWLVKETREGHLICVSSVSSGSDSK